MGTANSVAVAEEAELEVILDNPRVIPGSHVSGRVCFTVHGEKVDADTVMVSLTGAEYFKLNTRSRGNDLAPHYHPFLEESFPVAAGSFSRGQYEFQFAFKIPANGRMTPSIRGGELDIGFYSITYTVEAKVKTSRSRFTRFFKPDLKHQKEVTVLELPPMIPRSPICVAPVEYPLGDTSSRAGNIRLGFLVSSNILAAGEKFDVNYAIQNNSSNRIDRSQGRAVFHLIEEVRFGLNMDNPAISRTILSSKWFEHQEMLIDPSPSVEQNDSVSVRGGSSTTITHSQVLEQLRTIMNSPRCRFTLEVPTNSRPTINAKFIRVNHYVKMVMLTQKRHELVTGLTIYRPIPAANVLRAPAPVFSSFSSAVKQQTTVFPYQQLQHQELMQQRLHSSHSWNPLPLNNNQPANCYRQNPKQAVPRHSSLLPGTLHFFSSSVLLFLSLLPRRLSSFSSE
jgi:hypothetical protein